MLMAYTKATQFLSLTEAGQAFARNSSAIVWWTIGIGYPRTYSLNHPYPASNGCWDPCRRRRGATQPNIPWWRHQMETFYALLALCPVNSPVAGEFPSQGPVTRSFHVSLICALNKWLSKQSWGWWFEWMGYINCSYHYSIVVSSLWPSDNTWQH